NPRPPNDALGTSGMKAAMIDVVNISLLDGWWAEGYECDNGWALCLKYTIDDLEEAVAHDDDEFYRLFSDEVAPMYYDRDGDGIPQAWVERMRRSIISSLVRFSSHRMVADYVDLAYGPLSHPVVED